MQEIPSVDVPRGHRPRWLEGLQAPFTKDEAILYAEQHGAPEEALDFLEALPAAIFTSEAGLEHAFSTLDPEHLARVHHPRPSTPSHDGVTS